MAKSFQEEFEITAEEKELIIQQLAERFRSYVFMAAEDMTRRIVIDLWDVSYDPLAEITLNYEISQLAADLIVLLGEHRRKS